jgi:hypothetical protein
MNIPLQDKFDTLDQYLGYEGLINSGLMSVGNFGAYALFMFYMLLYSVIQFRLAPFPAILFLYNLLFVNWYPTLIAIQLARRISRFRAPEAYP